MTKLNKSFYLGSQIGLFVLSLVVSVVAILRVIEVGALRNANVFSPTEIVQLVTELIVELVLLVLLSIASSVIYLTLVYKMWASIQDGHARTSPGKAVGFLFIPFFQLYWFFQVWWGFAKDYNNYLRRHSLRLPELSEGLFLTFNILPFLVWIPFLGWAGLVVDGIIFLVIVSSVCEAVNGVSAGPGVRGIQSGVGVLGLQEYLRSPSLYCVSGEFGGHRVGIPNEGVIIGRNPSRANLILASDEVSAAHARVWPDASGSGLWIEDMHSTNGTYYCEDGLFAGRRRWIELRGRKLLGHGAHFRVGCDVAEFEVRVA
jgi:FHA domain